MLHIINKIKTVKLTSLFCVSLLCCSCATVDYVPNREVKYLQSAGIDNHYSTHKKLKKYGALVFKYSDIDDKSDSGRGFVIRREKSQYLAETMLFDSSADKSVANKKSYFKKSYLSVGTDRKVNSFGVRLRFLY